MDEWYYQRGGATFGPIGARQLLALRERGSLSDETVLRRGLTGNWSAFDEAALSEAATAQPPPLPPPMAAGPSPMTTKPGTGRLAVKGPSGWLWFFAVSAVMVTAAHSLVLTVNASSFALIMLPPVELPEALIQLSDFCAEALIWSTALYFSAVIIWTGSAFASLARVYGENNVPHGSGAGFWWLIPFANFVMPFRCLRMIRHLSRRLREGPGAEPSPSLSVLGIQVCFIASTVFRVLERVSKSSQAPLLVSDGTDNPFISMMWDLSLAAVSVQLAIFILINLIQQARLFDEARDAA